jgi:signal peptidase I
MRNSSRLSLREYLADLKMVLISPSERFAVIQERGAIWGSLLLLAIPYYFAFEWMGGIFFDSNPFPGYSFIIPAVIAIALALLRTALIHLVTFVFRKKKQGPESKGTCRKLLVVLGYSTLPGFLALIVGFFIFLLMPVHTSTLLPDYHGVTISIIIAIGITLFVWQLILAVLALRTIYPISDWRIVLSLLLGSILAGFGSSVLSAASVTIETDYRYLQPMLSERMISFVTANPFESLTTHSKARVGLDNLAYRFKAPRLFDVVAYSTGEETNSESHHSHILFWRPSWANQIQAVGRIVGLPGNTVELVNGQLMIDGHPQDEPYLTPESRSNQSLPLFRLGKSEYAIFPENRNLMKLPESGYVVKRDKIAGRLILNKWPFKWCLFKPNIFLRGQSTQAADP